MQRLCRNALAKGTAWFGICSQILESYWATQEKHKSHTSTGKKRALVDGLSHDLGTVPDRFTMSILRGRCGTVNYHHQFLNSIWTKKHIPGAKWPESCWQTVRRLNKTSINLSGQCISKVWHLGWAVSVGCLMWLPRRNRLKASRIWVEFPSPVRKEMEFLPMPWKPFLV